MLQAIILVDKTGKIVRLNEHVEQLFGYTSQELLGQNVEMLIPEQFRRQHVKDRNDYLASPKMRPMGSGLDLFAQRKDGTFFQADISLTPIETKEGVLTMAIIRDITEQTRLIRFTENILSTISSALIAIDKDFKIISVNRSFCEFFEINRKEVENKHVNEILNYIGLPEKYRSMILQRQKFHNVECAFVIPKKGIRTVQLTLSGIRVAEEEEEEEVLLVIDDITERKRAEAELRESEERFRLLAESALTGIYLIQDQKFLYVNESLAKIFGYKVEEIIGKLGPVDLTHPNDRPRVLENIKKRVTGEVQGLRYDFCGVKKDGSTIFVEVHGRRIEYGGKVGIIGTLVDITERKLSEQKLRDTLSLLYATLESTADGILVVNLEGKIVSFNQKFIQMWRIPSAVIASGDDKKALSFVLNQLKDPESFLKKVNELYSQPEAKSNDILIFKDGRIFERYSQPQKIGDKIVGRVWSFRDVTERKLAEEALRESEAKFRNVFETANEGILITDENEIIKDVNQKFADMVDYSVNELINKNFEFLLFEEDLPEHNKMMSERKKGITGNYERRLLKKDGSTIWTLVSASPIIDSTGEYKGSFGMFTNITERKQMEQDLIVAKEKAEEMSKLKTNFLTTMSHELRTPFVGIIGYAELLAESLSNPNDREMAIGILEGSKRMVDTLSKILNLSKLESEKIELAFKKIDLKELVENLCRDFKGAALQKGISLNTKINLENSFIECDESLLLDILRNLISNAIIYTNKGGVEVTVNSLIKNGRNLLQIKVSDTGIGIPKSKQEIIWQEFRQASEGTTREFQGVGLGLSIVKKSVELLGGKIHLESEIEKGSVFTVELPLENVTSQRKISTKTSIEKGHS
ncbi:PAS domain S-box protein [Melioribacteraceae bacterium 4301-Me]|uniref:PAS domain-containing protein n=1 Tax=Pyranulibacter aquaticus TaxID=3163344 RepID=UPI003598EFC0